MISLMARAHLPRPRRYDNRAFPGIIPSSDTAARTPMVTIRGRVAPIDLWISVFAVSSVISQSSLRSWNGYHTGKKLRFFSRYAFRYARSALRCLLRKFIRLCNQLAGDRTIYRMRSTFFGTAKGASGRLHWIIRHADILPRGWAH